MMKSVNERRPAGWGETRLHERNRQRMRRRYAIAGVALLMVAALPYLAGLLDGRGGQPAGTQTPLYEPLAAAVGLVAIVIVALVWHIRHADEVQRRITANTFAVTGFVGFFGRPVIEMLGRAFHSAPAADALWWTSLVAGAATFAWQRWRG